MVPPDSDRISLVPPYSGYSYAATRFRIHGFHVLWPDFPDRSSNKLQSTLPSYNPGHAVTPPVWAVPRSLATTCGITVVFSSCRYLDVSVPRVCPLTRRVSTSLWTGCPIRKSPGQGLFAPHRSLSQLVTSFFASESLGIPRTLLLDFLVSSFNCKRFFYLYRYRYTIRLILVFFLYVLFLQHVKGLFALSAQGG